MRYESIIDYCSAVAEALIQATNEQEREHIINEWQEKMKDDLDPEGYSVT